MEESTMSRLEEVGFGLEFPVGRPYDVVGLGMNAVDWICFLPEYPVHNSKTLIDDMLKLGGGPAATASTVCARYGLKVKYVGRVGDDEIGRFSLQDLHRETMDLSHVEVVEGAFSQFAVILVDRPTGERTVLWRRDPKLDYRPGQLQPEWITCGRVLHLDGHEMASRLEAARWARQQGMPVCLDIDRPQEGCEELLGQVDFAIPSEPFARSMGEGDWRRGLLAIDRLTPGWAIVTLGERGSAIAWENEIVEFPGYPVRVVEATGCGDVFHGAFVYAVLQRWNVGRCLRFANAAGALACTRYGARGGIASKREVLELAGFSEDSDRAEGRIGQEASRGL